MEVLSPIRLRVKRENQFSTSGVLEIQLDGSTIASASVSLRKESWDLRLAPEQSAPDLVDESAAEVGGSNQPKTPAKPAPKKKAVARKR